MHRFFDLFALAKSPSGVQTHDKQREQVHGCMGEVVGSENSISEWCQELQRLCEYGHYHEAEERL